MGERADEVMARHSLDADISGGSPSFDATGLTDPVTLSTDTDTSYGDTSTTDGAADQEPEQIRARIEETRTEMSETINAIQAKLSPDNLKEHAKEIVHDATVGRAEQMVSDATESARGMGNGILDTVKQNPVPAALAGLSLAWLFMKRPQGGSGSQMRGGYNGPTTYRSGYSGGSGGYTAGYSNNAGGYSGGYGGYGGNMGQYGNQGGIGDKVGDVAGQAANKVGDVASSAGDIAGQAAGKVGDVASQAGDIAGQAAGKVGDVASQAGDKVSQLGTEAQYKAQEATDWLQRSMISNPMAVGAVALALGAALGLAVPETPQEHKLLGSARDNLLDKAQTAVQDTVQKVQQVADKAGETVQQEAQNQGLTAQQ